jgi:hypothetical protein
MTSLVLNTEHKVKYSNYLITVNTNLMGVTEERKEELVEALRAVLTNIFQHDSFVELLDFLIIGDSYFGNVEDSEVHFSVEEGKKMKRIHAHAIVRIKHTTTIHWNYKKFRERVVEELRFELADEHVVPHIDIKAFGGRNPTRDAEDYIMKDLGDDNEERIVDHI